MRFAWRVLVVAAAACAHGHRPSTADAGLRAADLKRPEGLSAQSAVRSPQSEVRPARPRRAPAQSAAPDKDYLVFVASEGNDRIALIRFGPAGAKVERDHRMSLNPAELLGPHGIAVSPDGRYYYVTTAHGTPNGALWKFTTDRDSLVGRVELGAFPATVQVSPDGAYVYVVNFNLYGDPITSSVSIVYADQMVEVTRVPTCIMPHGSRLNPQGTKHYSVCMMNDALVEIDTRQFGVARHFMLTKGRERGGPGPVQPAGGAPMAGHDMSAMSHGNEPPKPGDLTCSPTWGFLMSRL